VLFLEGLVDSGLPADVLDYESLGLRSGLVDICSLLFRVRLHSGVYGIVAMYSLLCTLMGDGDKQMNKRERIIELATQIAEARQRLRAMEAEMDSLLPTEELSTNTVSHIKIEKGVPIPLALTERVIKFLEQHRERVFSATGIATGIELPADKITSLRSTLVRLVQERRIERPTPGTYRANRESDAFSA
jgi:hypothetical protein